MNEYFLHFIWKNRLMHLQGLTATSGETIEIVHQGYHNLHAGPDFTEAKIKINNTLWVGNVEIHVQASDWEKHSHHTNEQYNNVILHVVKNADKQAFRKNGSEIPTLVLQFDPEMFHIYNQLSKYKNPKVCSNHIHMLDSLVIPLWIDRLSVERLQLKSEEIITTLKQYNNNWEQVFYIFVARAFGFNVNAQPFEMIAKLISVTQLARQKDNLLQTEALLFGVAGFLDEPDGDNYYLQLKAEYRHLQAKYGLKSIPVSTWKFLRLRPYNFPTIRIAQFAALVHKSVSLFSKVVEAKTIDDLTLLFTVSASDYWDMHYQFNIISKKQVKNFGNDAVNLLLINVAAVFLFTYGQVKQNDDYKEFSLYLLENTNSEKNAIVDKWTNSGLKIENARQSQALLQLDKHYCREQRCLDCQIGTKLLLSKHLKNLLLS